MRELSTKELTQVSGAGKSSCYVPPKCPPTRMKGNNGFGNGGNDGSNAGFEDVNR